MRKNNRAYCLVGVGVKMGNWNADMTGYPKQTANGEFFGSDKALKFAIRDLWDKQGERIFAKKAYDSKLIPVDPKGKYDMLFGENKKKDVKDVAKNLTTLIDVRTFGCTYAEAKVNFSLTGAVQVGQGINKWKDSDVELIDIMSPFKSGEDKGQTSLGKKIVIDEAHYVYPVTVNPSNYDGTSIGNIEGFDGYSEEDYKKLKNALLYSATALQTDSKTNAENEFSIFIECKDGEDVFLANLDDYVKIYREKEERILDINELMQYITPVMDKIKSIEVYYNTHTFTIRYDDCSAIKKMNMFGDEI